MCLAVINWNPTSQYPVKVVANRDEFRHRPALAMHWWDQPSILAGKDLEAGGSWLGFNRLGNFALLTNIRPGFVGMSGQLSRGDLVVNFLSSEKSITEFHKETQSSIGKFGGFNLLIGNAKEIFWFSSTNPNGQWLKPGVHGLSNDSLNTPWPKTELAIHQMHQESQLLETSLTAHNILSSQNIADDASLPETGVPVEWERAISAQTIVGKEYGTRCRTHFVIDKNKNINVTEEQVDSEGKTHDSVTFSFSASEPN
jgi:uncharacterized protein with NRDE domain